MRVFLSAGEASGDAVAAKLLDLIREEAPELQIEPTAIGSRRLEASGAKLLADSSTWGAIGILSIAKVFLKGYLAYWKATRHLKSGTPGLLIPVDAGFINVPLARFARKHGWRVLYLNPPGSWKKETQGKDLPHAADIIVTPFAWSAEMLRSMGANVYWFGHPILEMANYEPDVSARGDTIAVLPGSRKAEVELIMPIIAKAIADESRICEIGVASTISESRLRELWKIHAPNRTQDRFYENDTYGVLRRARAGIVCSGTATLEAALCRCPFVVVYKVTYLAAIEAALLRRNLNFISQPNILMGRPIVRELLQETMEPEYLRQAIKEALDDEDFRAMQLDAFGSLKEQLGDNRALTKTAELAIQEIRNLPQNDEPV